jgi:hypothetical protein
MGTDSKARRGAFADAAALAIKSLPRVLQEENDIDVIAYFAQIAFSGTRPAVGTRELLAKIRAVAARVGQN